MAAETGAAGEGTYLEGVSRLTLEGDHIVHQVALTDLHPVTGHGRFRTAAQAHGCGRQTERRMEKAGRW